MNHRTIWKFELTPTTTEIKLSPDAEILKVGTQNNEPVLWALTDPSGPQVPRRIVVYCTGQSIPEGDIVEHLGSFQLNYQDVLEGGSAWLVFMPGNYFVGHVFEKFN